MVEIIPYVPYCYVNSAVSNTQWFATFNFLKKINSKSLVFNDNRYK